MPKKPVLYATVDREAREITIHDDISSIRQWNRLVKKIKTELKFESGRRKFELGEFRR